MISRRIASVALVVSTTALVACGVSRWTTTRHDSVPATAAGTSRARLVAPPTLSDRDVIAALVGEYRRGVDRATAYEVAALIESEARARGIDPLFVAAVAAVESSFRVTAVSHMGAMGLMQIRPFVGEDVAMRLDGEWDGPESLHEAETNVRLGTHYLLELLDRFDGDARLALAAYHRGPTRVAVRLAEGLPLRSHYAERVLALHSDLAARRRGAPAATVADARGARDANEG